MENSKSMNSEITKTNLKKSLLASSKYIDPRKEPCKWLEATLIDLLEQDTKESKAALKWAFQRMALWLEPGIIDQLFVPWIEEYLSLLAQHENNHNISDQQSPQEDQTEL